MPGGQGASRESDTRERRAPSKRFPKRARPSWRDGGVWPVDRVREKKPDGPPSPVDAGRHGKQIEVFSRRGKKSHRPRRPNEGIEEGKNQIKGFLRRRKFLAPPAQAKLGMVGARGFEPPTPASRTRCATGLRYAPINASEPPGVRKSLRTACRARQPRLGTSPCPRARSRPGPDPRPSGWPGRCPPRPSGL